ncbi:MAG: Modification methylase MjaI [Methanocella sp. PtaU1.Bin125]|nr:MAG: Modification methylase MjaI [Methanocella sp. PtaU1.Bin125]
MITTHRLFFKDARRMGDVAPGSIHLTVTSPPYPMIEMWDSLFCSLNPLIKAALDNGDGRLAHGLMHRELDRVWRGVDRATAPSGIVCVNVGDATRALDGTFRLYSNHDLVARFFREAGYDELPPVLWRKQTNKPNKFMGSGMLPPNAYVTLEHEHIRIFRKGGTRAFSPDSRPLRHRSAYFWEERNAWFSDVWDDLKGAPQRLEGPRGRSAAYPFDLPYRLIHMFSVQGDHVLDPFLGTGTTMFAAMIAGRNSTGYEMDASLRPVIASKIDGLKAMSRSLVDERLARHEAYVSDRLRDGGKATEYVSKAYGFPVVTGQETGIELPVIKEIRSAGDRYVVTYE